MFTTRRAALRRRGPEETVDGAAAVLPWIILAAGLVLAALAAALGRQRRAARAAQEEVDRIFKLSPDLIAVADFDGHFTRVNPAVEQCSGTRRRSSSRGRTSSSSIPTTVSGPRRRRPRSARQDDALVREPLPAQGRHVPGARVDVDARRRGERHVRGGARRDRAAGGRDRAGAAGGRAGGAAARRDAGRAGRAGGGGVRGRRRGGRAAARRARDGDRATEADGTTAIVAGELPAATRWPSRSWSRGRSGARSRRNRAPSRTPAEQRQAEFTELAGPRSRTRTAGPSSTASRARVVAASDETRRQIERDLHDGAQQRLAHTVITLKLARPALQRTTREPLRATRRSGTPSRRPSSCASSCTGSCPPVLTRGGLYGGRGVARLADAAAGRGRRDLGPAPAAVEATAYFVVAEALTNVAKHSAPSSVGRSRAWRTAPAHPGAATTASAARGPTAAASSGSRTGSPCSRASCGGEPGRRRDAGRRRHPAAAGGRLDHPLGRVRGRAPV